MTTTTPTASLLARLRDSSILAGWQVNELKRIDSTQALGRQLLQRGWLTPFQVNQALTGQWDSLLVGPYVLQERLGKGGMGQVFKAWHLYLARQAAVKIIRKERSHDPSIVGRFRREIQAVAQLSHPNIVLAFDADEFNGALYLAMEYVEGITLSRLVRRHGPLPIADACDYIRQAALGLEHAAERGMVHRDIKPSNLLVTHPRADGARTLKILDLGLARLDEFPSDDGGELTLPGMVIGTPDYLAPEQAASARLADVRSDLYSLGCTFYFLVTGMPPFPGGSPLEKVIWHRTLEPKPVTELRPGLAEPVAALIRSLMAKDPAKRLASPALLVEELDDILSRCPETLTDLPALTHIMPAYVESAPTISLARMRWLRFLPGWRLLAAGIAALMMTALTVLFARSWNDAPAAVQAPVQAVPRSPVPGLDGPWHVLGPFDFHPEHDYNGLAPLGSVIDLRRSYRGKGGATVAWKPLPRFRVGEVIDLRLFKQNDAAAVFLHTRIDCPYPLSLPISLGSDDTLAVWLNGDLLLAHRQQRAAAADQDRVLLPLRAGRNDLVLKIGNLGGSWGFYVKPVGP